MVLNDIQKLTTDKVWNIVLKHVCTCYCLITKLCEDTKENAVLHNEPARHGSKWIMQSCLKIFLHFFWVGARKRLIQGETADSCQGVLTDSNVEVSWVWLAQINFISQADSLAKVKEYFQLPKKTVRVEGMWVSHKLYYRHWKRKSTGHLAKSHLAKSICMFWPR